MPALQRDLVDQGMELRETHISQVFLTADTVYKVKKPVQLGFLDFGSLDRRKHFCDAELALNRRLAPSVYRGVVPITRDGRGVHRIGGEGEAVEWAVEMRRLPDVDAADRRLREGRLGREDVRRLAECIACFHAAAPCDERCERFGDVAVIEANVRENFEQTRQSAARFIDARELAALEAWQVSFLRDQAARLRARVSQHRIRDGHGDLRLEHCYLDDAGGIEIIDCIEFNERFRYGDVSADLAFLSMDLSWHERHDLSELLLAEYARASGDYDLYGVVDFYESYRAHVRGKVSAIVEADASISETARASAAAQARKYYLLAEACTRDPLQRPALYAVGGVIAAGKSTLAERLALQLDASVIDADRTRKALAGVTALTPLPEAAFSGHYDEQRSAAVYDELLRRAAVVLDSKRPVILDASFRARAQRLAALALAERFQIPFLFIECAVDPAVSRARLVKRARAASVSDGRLEVFDAFLASYEPVRELPQAAYLRVDTGAGLDAAWAQVSTRLS